MTESNVPEGTNPTPLGDELTHDWPVGAPIDDTQPIPTPPPPGYRPLTPTPPPPPPPGYVPRPPEPESAQYIPQPPPLQQPVVPGRPVIAPMATSAPQRKRMSPAVIAAGTVGVLGLLAGAVGVSYGLGQRSSKTSEVKTVDTSAKQVTSTVATQTTEATTAETTAGGVGGTGKDKVNGGTFTIDRIKSSMIRIETKGSYRPFGGENTTSAGSGSGFIMSADGLAVTNNHVVAGAAVVEVFIGDDPTARPARVLGRSECSDLALIDIDGGDFKALSWSNTAITPGVDVYAAGFPLGDTEPTLTKGIVSKAKAFGDTPWASINHVVEHDANIQPGNSGGPLVTSDGNVLGINYAGADRGNTGTTQFFAIANDIARPIVDRLRTGDFETLGVNGQAFRDEKEKISGVWVQGVADGSAASKIGLRPGDVITTLRGFPVGLDGTMRDYCKVVRSAADTDVVGVEIFRPDAKKSYAGEFRGEPLRETFSFASPEVGGRVDTPDAPSETPSAEEVNFETVTDETGRISVDVPKTWTPIDGAGFDAGKEIGTVPAIIASPDPRTFKESNDVIVPGVFIAAIDLDRFGVPAGTNIPDTLYDTLLDSIGDDVKKQCTIGDRSPFDRSGVSGRFQLLTDCGSEKASAFVVVAAPPDGRYITLILSVAQTEADVFALDRVISTFKIQ
jgi:serine protease Do